MCGRFTLATPGDDLVEVFEVPALTFQVEPRYNIAPGQDTLVVARDRRGRRMGLLRWGFPSRTGRPGSGFVNARAEGVGTRPSFRQAFVHRRCLVPADGFYEWRKGASGNEPFLFRATAGGVMGLAGIWERREIQGSAPDVGFAILTVPANPDVAPVHARMPVVVRADDFSTWLDAEAPLERIHALLRPLPEASLNGVPVSPRVNRVGEDDEGLIVPLDPEG